MKRRVISVVVPLVCLLGCGDGGVNHTPSSGNKRPPGTYSPGSALWGAQPLEGGTRVCFYTSEDKTHPAATVEHRLELTQGVDTLHARLTLDPRFVDNTYGANAQGWGDADAGKAKKNEAKGRAFKSLVGSDQATLRMLAADGSTALSFRVDYISEDSSAPSGYATLGVLGGDGEMLTGNASAVVDTMTSIDRNVNERGYASYLVDSPATDAKYTPNPSAPNWDYLVVYEAWVKLDAFPGGFGDAHVDYIHASPSKLGENTVTVVRDRCPPEWECPDPSVPACKPPPTDAGTPPGCQYDSQCPDGELCWAGECNSVTVQ